MIEIISIHIPKTAGMSFHSILEQVYGDRVSKHIKRRHIQLDSHRYSPVSGSIDERTTVIHGHFYYEEIQTIHQSDESKVIFWLREPVSRVISNYRFFIRGLQNPVNLTDYENNKHRINETLLEYASHEGNRNRMSKFTRGLNLDSAYFIGFLESFKQDVFRLAELLHWPQVRIPALNSAQTAPSQDGGASPELYAEISELNQQDIELYDEARRSRRKPPR